MRTAYLYSALGETLPLLAVDIAATAWERIRRLLGFAALAPGHGLVIQPCRFVHSCGQPGSIDVVFLDSDWVVIHVAPGLPPWRVALRLDAAKALELSGGDAKRLGLYPGMKLYCLEPPADLSVWAPRG